MPVCYQIEASLKCIFVKMEGIIDGPELISDQRKPLSSRAATRDYSMLRAVTKLLVTADCVEGLSKSAA